jgi:predicted nucleotidyltransferase
MIRDPCLDPTIVERIEVELGAIERVEGVRILLAVESGSRAWRFPSRDSDYDIRFLYVRPLTDYLTVTPRRDVIERPVDAVLDMKGWDIRKALRLGLSSNAALLEWLNSPVRYRAIGDAPARLGDFLLAVANPITLAHHYASLGRRSFADIETAGAAVRLKTYCYALRAALALGWLRAQGTPPPMELPALLAGVELPQGLPGVVAALVAGKRAATESDSTARITALDTWLRNTLEAPMPDRAAPRRAGAVLIADEIFASIVRDALPRA